MNGDGEMRSIRGEEQHKGGDKDCRVIGNKLSVLPWNGIEWIRHETLDDRDHLHSKPSIQLPSLPFLPSPVSVFFQAEVPLDGP